MQFQEATRPSSASEVRSFLGLVGFSSRFIPDFATKVEPLRVLCRKDEKFVWGKAHEEALNTLKEDMAGASMLAYFDREVPTEGRRQPGWTWYGFGSGGRRGPPCSILC